MSLSCLLFGYMPKSMKYEDFKLTATKKVAFSKKRSQKLIASQELWKSLKYLGLPKKKKNSNFNSMQDNDTLTYDTRTICTDFKKLFLNLAESVLTKFPNPLDKYNLESVINYYSNYK